MSSIAKLSVLLLALVLLLSGTSVAKASIPPWFDTVGGTNAEAGFGIATSPNGLIVSVGITNTTCDGVEDFTDSLITMYNVNGTLLQVYLFDNTSIDNITAITYHNGKFFIAGTQYNLSTSTSYFVVMSLDASTHNVDWAKHYTLTGLMVMAHGIIATDNYIYVAGETYNPATYDRNITVLRLYHNGTEAGALMLGTPTLNETAWNVISDSNDNIYIAGFAYGGTPVDKDVMVAKFDSSGSLEWVKRINLTIADYAYDLTFCNGKLIVVGETREDIYGNDILVLALDPTTGNIEWVKRINYSRYDEGFGIVSQNGNCYIVGGGFYTYPHIEEYDIFLAYIDDSGNLLGFWKLDGGSLDVGIDIASLDNYVYITGVTNSSGEGSYEMFTMKFGGEGQYRWIGGEGWTPVNATLEENATSTNAVYSEIPYSPIESGVSYVDPGDDLSPYITPYSGFGWHIALFHPPPVGGELYSSEPYTPFTVLILGITTVSILGGIIYYYKKQ